MSAFKIALAQYPIDRFDNFSGYEKKIMRWVEEAVGNNAKLLVFPEYGSMELTSLLPVEEQRDFHASIKAMQEFWPKVQKLHKKLALRHDIYILGASFPVDRINTAVLYAPNGKKGLQQKSIMTRFERENWNIRGAGKLRVFETALGKIGIAICYDSEFPLLVRALAEAGADIILVPSCTDTLAGYHRVKVGVQARALENQCYVAQSPTIGEALWSPAVDINIGAAGLFGPPDRGFPYDGVIVLGEMNKPGWIYAPVDFDRVRLVRTEGQVLNYAHWHEQGKVKLPRVKEISLI